MKKVILTVAIVLATLSTQAQTGVITVKDKNQLIKLGQWYMLERKGWENTMIMSFENESKMDEFLKKYLEEVSDREAVSIDLSNAQTDPDGDKFWKFIGQNQDVIVISRMALEDKKDYNVQVTIISEQ